MQTDNIYSKLAIISFSLYIFFILFGTTLPFQERAIDASDISTSNVANQIIFTALFLISIITLFHKIDNVISVIKEEKFLALFLLFCTFSIVWSNYSLITFKRLFRFYTEVIVCLSFLLYAKSLDDALVILRIILGAYVVVTFVTIFTIPAAIDSYGDWRGITLQKNLLGQSSLISVLVWGLSLKDKRKLVKFFYTIMMLISLILLIGSKSSTSLIALVIIVISGVLFSLEKYFVNVEIRKTFPIIIILYFILVIVSSYLLVPQLINSIFKEGGKNITFTGRTEIWSYILSVVKKHWLLGCGYQGFWIMNDPNIIKLWPIFHFQINESHNGYIDLLNETGLIGLLLVFSIVINYFYKLNKFKRKNSWKWFILANLIVNILESVLFRGGLYIIEFMFVFAYLELFTSNQFRIKGKLIT